MGINIQSLKAILFENAYKPIYGNVLLIGKSTVAVSKSKLDQLLFEYLERIPVFSIKDNKTKHATLSDSDYSIDDRELFQQLSSQIENIDVMDISPYEGANVVCDLNKSIPEALCNKYDFIYDSSVLDNLFNPASFLVNVASMLKPKGRFIGINVASFFPGAMVSVHPEWFYGFFAVNKFNDCRVYLTQSHQHGINRFECETDLWLYRPQYTKSPGYDYYHAVKSTNGICYTLVVAEKSAVCVDRQEFEFPINLQYITSSSASDWTSHHFDEARPLMKGTLIEGQPEPYRPHLTDHYLYLGSQF